MIESLLVVLILALLASAVTLSLAGPLRRARANNSIATIEEAITHARALSLRFNRPTRLTLDLDQSTLSVDRRTHALASPCRITDLRTPDRHHTSGTITLECSPAGLLPTFALHVHGPDIDQWLLIAGLTGEISRTDESTAQSILRTLARPDAR